MTTARIFLTSALILLAGCQPATKNQVPSAAVGPDADGNPLLTEWTTPYGTPPFDQIEDEHYLPAFRASIERHLAEVDEISSDSAPPTFENTIEALERSGGSLSRVGSVFFAVNGANTNDTLQGVAETVSSELASHSDDITLNTELFARVEAVYQTRDQLGLDAEQLELLEKTRKDFVRSGVNLPDNLKPRLRAINAELASLVEHFERNLLDETNAFEIHVTEEADLGDLPASLRAGAADVAKDRGHEDGWSFTLQRPSINPFLQYSPNRELRRQLFEGYRMRGDNDNESDNKTILGRIVALRAEKAGLLGYDTWSHFSIEDVMAETPQRVYDLLDQVWQPALAKAKTESTALEAMMHAEGIEGELEGWDWRHYAEKVRKAEYDLDEEEMRPYFEFTAVRDGAFWLAAELFGLTFRPLEEVTRWHPDQEVFSVHESDGSLIGILYMDYFIRGSKRGGAWMNELRAQSRLDGEVKPIVTNNFNFPPPTDDTPSLLSFREAQTLFHEFGHALHGLLSDVTYQSLSGTNVAQDFVEFPSQVMENWMSEPEVLRQYARHFETGEVIPDALIDKLKAAATFDQGFTTVEYLAAAYLDMAWHSLPAGAENTPNVRDFELAELDRIGLVDEIPPRYRTTYFAHITGGYDAGYYSYLWSEVLDADAFQAFRETSIFDQESARRFRRLLAQGGSRPGMDLYLEFRGREPVITPLLERRGLNPR